MLLACIHDLVTTCHPVFCVVVGRDPVEALEQYKMKALASEVSCIHHLEERLDECAELEKGLGNAQRLARKMKKEHMATIRKDW